MDSSSLDRTELHRKTIFMANRAHRSRITVATIMLIVGGALIWFSTTNAFLGLNPDERTKFSLKFMGAYCLAHVPILLAESIVARQMRISAETLHCYTLEKLSCTNLTLTLLIQVAVVGAIWFYSSETSAVAKICCGLFGSVWVIANVQKYYEVRRFLFERISIAANSEVAARLANFSV